MEESGLIRATTVSATGEPSITSQVTFAQFTTPPNPRIITWVLITSIFPQGVISFTPNKILPIV
jgi:hypothetical protein